MRFRLVPTLVVLLLLAVLLGLGAWQLQRGAWKADLIKGYETQRVLPPLAQVPESMEEGRYRRIALRGHFLKGASIKVRPRVRNGVMGYDRITPFLAEDGKTILVLQGFEADTKETPEVMEEDAVRGWLRPFYPRGFMQPENRPGKGAWYWLEPERVAAYFHLPPLAPVLLVAGPMPEKPDFPNNHGAYAATWFSLAFVLLVIYLRASTTKRDE